MVLEDALCHLEAVGGRDLEVAEDEAGHEDLCPLLLHRKVGDVSVESVQLEALGHEDGLCGLLYDVLE